MYGARKPLNVGVNATVGVEPQAQAQATANNTVIVNPPQTSDTEVKDRTTPLPVSSFEAVRERSEVDEILLEIYSAMLLYQNKQLLTNILTKNAIIITQEDLPRVIEAKTGKKCVITLKESPEVGCLSKVSPIRAVDSIHVIDDSSENDFKVADNSDYIELTNVYHLSLKYVVA